MSDIQIARRVLYPSAPLHLNDHWEQCSGGVAPPSKKKRITTSTRRLPIQKKTRTSARPTAGYKNKRAGKRNMMDETERKALIESDVWAGEVTAISVECKGCGKTVSLDKRSMYYPGLWIKHRSKCPAIRRLEGRTEKLDEEQREAQRRRSRKTVKLEGSDRSPSVHSSEDEDEDVSPPIDSGHKLRYDVLSSQFPLAESDTRGTDQGYRNENIHHGSHRPWQSVSPRISEENRTGEKRSIERASSSRTADINGIQYWSTAPFAPDIAVTQSSGTGRLLYRYSTRYELATSFKDATEVLDENVDLWSDDVMEAAHCLASLSRA